MPPTQEYHPHPRNPKTELRTLKVSHPGKDYLADGWDGKMVLVTGWFVAWRQTGDHPKHGPLWQPVWSARVLELPDRFFSEDQLLRIL